MVSCMVSGCRNHSTNSRIRFFQLPRDSQRRALWTAFANRQNILSKYSKICEAHFDISQFEQKRQDGWQKLKWTAVPTLHPPLTENQLNLSTDHKRPSKNLPLASAKKIRQMDGNKDCHSMTAAAGKVAGKPQNEQMCDTAKYHEGLDTMRERSAEVITDKEVLRSIMNTIAENVQNVLQLIQETSKQKCRLMQLVNRLAQKEITLQQTLKKELEKERALKRQLQIIEHMDKDGWKKEQAFNRDLESLAEKENLESSAGKENDSLFENSLREAHTAKEVELNLSESLVTLSVNCLKADIPGEAVAVKSTDNANSIKQNRCKNFAADLMQTDAEKLFTEGLHIRIEGNENDCFSNSSYFASKLIGNGKGCQVVPLISVRHKHICCFCGEHFWNAGARRSHELTHGEKFRCDVCSKVFSYRAGLRNHKNRHSNEKLFACTLCERRVKTNGSLKRHIRSHTHEKHFACSVCSETFFYSHQRQVHMSVHTGEQPYVCQQCGQNFSTSNCLNRHALIHRGEKPFECDTCGKKFRQRNQVKAHKEIHGEKPYVCECCGKRLGYGSFWNHMREHNGSNRTKSIVFFQCAVCDKKLTTKKTLEMHTRTIHMGEAPYICGICSKDFRKYKDYRVHKKEHNDLSSK